MKIIFYIFFIQTHFTKKINSQIIFSPSLFNVINIYFKQEAYVLRIIKI